jgi:dienelactone hydrolase
MFHIRFATILMLAVPVIAVAAGGAGSEPVTLTAADGSKVYGDVWHAAGARPPVIVAFHQAESSAAEYVPVAPRLVQAGFTVLAIDARSGGGDFKGANRTVAARGGTATEYDATMPDLEAALSWATREAHGAPVVILGSSYSAALVFLLAAAHPRDVAGVVAFSPAEYLDRKGAVAKAAARVSVPVYIDQAAAAEEIASSAAILHALKSVDKQQFVSTSPSTHGSSTLRADSNAGGAEAHWPPLLGFLGRFTSR